MVRLALVSSGHGSNHFNHYRRRAALRSSVPVHRAIHRPGTRARLQTREHQVSASGYRGIESVAGANSAQGRRYRRSKHRSFLTSAPPAKAHASRGTFHSPSPMFATADGQTLRWSDSVLGAKRVDRGTISAVSTERARISCPHRLCLHEVGGSVFVVPIPKAANAAPRLEWARFNGFRSAERAPL